MNAPRPLEGRTVVITRPREEAGSLAARLRARGATPLLAPSIELRPAPRGELVRALDDAASGRYAWVIFTSRAGVEAMLEASVSGHRELRGQVAAIGAGTAAALRDRGIEPHLVPATFTTTALVRALPRGSGRVLLARADIAPEGMEDALARKGWEPVRLDAYRTRPVRRLGADVARAIRDGRADAITFTSASTVRGFLGLAKDILRASPRRPRVVCIGPVTARAARESGLRVDAVAAPHTIEGLVAAVERAFAPRRRSKEAG